MLRNKRLLLLAFVLVAGAGWLFWRWYGQTVDVVIVNASGLPGQFSWQPQALGDEVTDSVGGCESKSIQLQAGERWQFDHDRIQASSSAVDVPLFVKEVAVEIWLGADGSSRLIAAHPIDSPIDAPHPLGCATQGDATSTADPVVPPGSAVAVDCGPIVDHALCLQAVEVATTAKINPPPVVEATLRRPRPDDDCVHWFHRCGPEGLVVEIQSGNTIQAIPLIRSDGGWFRLDLVR